MNCGGRADRADLYTWSWRLPPARSRGEPGAAEAGTGSDIAVLSLARSASPLTCRFLSGTVVDDVQVVEGGGSVGEAHHLRREALSLGEAGVLHR